MNESGNPVFNVTEFRNIKNESGSNGFILSSKNWISRKIKLFQY